MLKILFDHQCFSYQNYGGISRYFTEIIKNIKELRIADIEISLKYSNNTYLNKIDFISIKPFLSPYKFKGKTFLLNLLNKKISIDKFSKGNFDIFHPTYYNPYFLDYIKSQPFVLTVHDMIHELYPDSIHKLDKTAKYKKQLVKKAKKIICVSNNTKEDLKRIYDVDDEKIEVIYHANSLSYTKDIIFERNLEIPDKYILYVGNRSYYKNFHLMIKSIFPILKNDKDLFLICAGGNCFNKNELSLFRDLNILPKVRHLSVNDKLLGALYSNAQCFIFPSIYEGFGIPILESFYSGCPVVCSNTGPFPEIAQDAAEYFDPLDSKSISDAVEKVIYNSNRQNELIEKGYNRLKNFSWDKTAKQTVEVYKKCM